MICPNCGHEVKKMQIMSGAVPADIVTEVKNRWPEKTNSELVRMAFEALIKTKQSRK